MNNKHNILTLLSGIGIPLPIILHLRRFLMEHEVYAEFCQSVANEFISKCAYAFSSDYFKKVKINESHVFNIISLLFLWDLHKSFIEWSSYSDLWKKHVRNLYSQDKINKYY